LWTEWSVEVRVLSGALEKAPLVGAFSLLGVGRPLRPSSSLRRPRRSSRGAGYNRKQRTGNTGRLPQRRSQGTACRRSSRPFAWDDFRLRTSSETTCRLDEIRKPARSTRPRPPRHVCAEHAPASGGGGVSTYPLGHVDTATSGAALGARRWSGGPGAVRPPRAPGQPRTPGQRGLAAGNSLTHGQRQLDHPDIGTTERYHGHLERHVPRPRVLARRAMPVAAPQRARPARRCSRACMNGASVRGTER
jgi:hypothetical protein